MRMQRVLRGGVVVALLALVLTACGGGDSGGNAYREPTGPAVKTLRVESGNLWFRPKRLVSPAGIVGIELENTESGVHTLVLEGVPGFGLEVSGAGDTDSGKVRLTPKRYVFYCTVPGHRQAGMEGTLTVG